MKVKSHLVNSSTPEDVSYQQDRVLAGMYHVATIYFPTSGSTLDKDDRDVICLLAVKYGMFAARSSRFLRFLFAGRADPRGTLAINVPLAKQRAASVHDFFRDMIARVAGHWQRGLSGTSLPPTNINLLTDSSTFDPEKTSRSTKRGQELAMFRSVHVWASLSPEDVDMFFRGFTSGYRRMARTAYKKHVEAVTNLKRQAETYMSRLQGDPNSVHDFNFGEWAWFESELEEYAASLHELEQILQSGSVEDFSRWQKDYRKGLDRTKAAVLGRLKAERDRLVKLIAGLPPAEDKRRSMLEEVVDRMSSDIKAIEEADAAEP